MRNAHAIAVDIRRAAFAQGEILFDGHSLPQAVPAMLDAAYWHEGQSLQGRGGRGAALLVRGPFGEGVLRHYRRGGLIGRWIDDRYLFIGASHTRCAREFHLLAHLWERGLPVPRPLLAGWRRVGLFYRADLLTLRIPEAYTLAECLRDGETDLPWRAIGTTLACFHREGVFHADLNAHNVMIGAGERVSLIDFDRGRLRVPSQDWQQANLNRLRRSLDKIGGVGQSDWQALIDGYSAAMIGASPDDIP